MVGGFEVFGDAFGGGELFDEAVAHFIGGAVYFLQVRIEGLFHLHGMVDDSAVVLQIVMAAHAPDADLGGLRELLIGNVVVSLAFVSKAVFRVIDGVL